MNEFPLISIFENEQPIFGWDFLCEDPVNSWWRLYFKPIDCYDSCNRDCDKKHGFDFHTVLWCGNNTEHPMWGSHTYVESLYHGAAYFDGLRHVYLGSEATKNYGYINYPNANYHIEIWNQLKFLEDKYCRKD